MIFFNWMIVWHWILPSISEFSLLLDNFSFMIVAYMMQEQELHATEVLFSFWFYISSQCPHCLSWFPFVHLVTIYASFVLLSDGAHFHCNQAWWSPERAGKITTRLVLLILEHPPWLAACWT